MVTDVVTVRPEASFHDAVRLMQTRGVRRLPVVDEGKLVGLVTESHFRELGAKEGSASYRYYLVSKETIRRLMIKKVITVDPDTPIEECAALATKHNIGTFPVLENNKLVGILTSTDLFRILINLLGFDQQGTRIRVVGDQEGKMRSEVSELICKLGAPVQSIFPISVSRSNRTDLIVHLGTDDTRELVEQIEAKGYALEVRPH